MSGSHGVTQRCRHPPLLLVYGKNEAGKGRGAKPRRVQDRSRAGGWPRGDPGCSLAPRSALPCGTALTSPQRCRFQGAGALGGAVLGAHIPWLCGTGSMGCKLTRCFWLQATRRKCGSTSMQRMQAAPSSARSSGTFWMEWRWVPPCCAGGAWGSAHAGQVCCPCAAAGAVPFAFSLVVVLGIQPRRFILSYLPSPLHSCIVRQPLHK